MEAVSAYSLATTCWLAAQAVPTLVAPRMVGSLLALDSSSSGGAAAVDVYALRHAALAQLGLGLATLAVSGVLPLGGEAGPGGAAVSPYASAAVLVSALYHAACALYGSPRWGANAVSALGGAGSAALAAFGLWCLLFAGDKGHISRRTGADKRTSGFPFRNAVADRRKGI